MAETLDSGCNESIPKETLETSELHRALIEVCKGPALVIAEGVPANEELEAGLLLWRSYEREPSSSR